MTQDRLTHFLIENFSKWKVVEDCEEHHIVIKVVGPINLFKMCMMGNAVPAGVKVDFYTMGFWESIFSSKTDWVTHHG